MATTEEVQAEVGLRIAELRRERGTTQAEFAATVGMSERNYRNIEAGRMNVTLDTLVRIAGSLGVPIAALFELATERVRSPAVRVPQPKKSRR